MKVYTDLSLFSGVEKPILTTGTFDGVHIGHRKIIQKVNDIASGVGGESVVLTFHPHPRMVLYPDDNSLRLLSTIDERKELLEQAGVQHLIIHQFSRDFSRLTALDYVRDVLVNAVDAHTIVVGYDHHFGRNREGHFDNLQEYGSTYGFKVEEISALEVDDVNISSTKIRTALIQGNVDLANKYLGYAYTIPGIVRKGQGLGRKMDFPTANIEVQESYKLIPANGVYAVKAHVNGSVFEGMLNIGLRPTVSDSGETTIEAHLFGLKSEIYDEKIKLELLRRIRDERKFEDLSALKAQLEKDKNVVKDILKEI